MHVLYKALQATFRTVILGPTCKCTMPTSNSKLPFDIVVVGAGPAGSAAAITAAKAGFSVALVDKASFPRDKLCGGLFTGRSRQNMTRIFNVDVYNELFLECSKMRFRAGDRIISEVLDAPIMWLTMRRNFDEFLFQTALGMGVNNFTGSAALEVNQDENCLQLKDGSSLSYKVLIGCDGVNSSVAKSLFGSSFDPTKIGFGLEVEVPIEAEKSPEQTVEVDFSAADWGYGWSFPKHKSTTIGLGGINVENPNMKQRLAEFLTRYPNSTDLKVKGQYLPFGDFRKSPGKANILLAGDAAGLVDPVTGEGIALAMHSGELAALAASDAIKSNAPQKALRRYKKALRPTHQSLRQAKLWRLMMFPKPMRSVFQNALANGSSLQNMYLDILAGKAEYKNIKGALISRAPKAVFRMIRSKLGV